MRSNEMEQRKRKTTKMTLDRCKADLKKKTISSTDIKEMPYPKIQRETEIILDIDSFIIS